MKKTNFIVMSAAMVALVAVTGIAISTYAQDNTGNTAFERPFRMHEQFNLTDEQKAELEATREERQADMEANREKIQSAMDQGYDAWVAAVKEVQGEDAPILSQVNADNFERFSEGHNYMEQGRAIFEELDIERGFGYGGCHGRHDRGGKMMGGFGPAGGTQTPQVQ